jgi:hypothetical protein
MPHWCPGTFLGLISPYNPYSITFWLLRYNVEKEEE